MTKDVIVHISGLHIDSMEGTENEPIEVYTPASYYEKNGKIYVIYDEVQEDVPGVTKNKIKITGTDKIEILKTGVSNTHMMFEKDSRNETYYDTQYGQMLIGLNTKNLVIDMQEEKIEVSIDYELDVNHEPLASSKVQMNISSKGTNFSLGAN